MCIPAYMLVRGSIRATASTIAATGHATTATQIMRRQQGAYHILADVLMLGGDVRGMLHIQPWAAK